MPTQKEHCPRCNKEVMAHALYYFEYPKKKRGNGYRQVQVKIGGAWICGECKYIHLPKEEKS